MPTELRPLKQIIPNLKYKYFIQINRLGEETSTFKQELFTYLDNKLISETYTNREPHKNTTLIGDENVPLPNKQFLDTICANAPTEAKATHFLIGDYITNPERKINVYSVIYFALQNQA